MPILLAPAAALMAAMTMLFMFIAFVTAMIAFPAALAVAIVAYVKREEWTLPAYRWARDRTGQWRMTPWSSSDGGQVAEEKPTAEMS
jgi:hypothetical protein